MSSCEAPVLSGQEISNFEQDGVVLLRGVLDRYDLETLMNGIEGVVDNLHASATGYDVSDIRRQVFDDDGDAVQIGDASQYNLSKLGAVLRSSGARPLLDRMPAGAPKRGHFRLDTTTWRRNKYIRAMALDSVLPEIAAQLLRATKINYCDDQIFVKDPGTADRTAFHQDYTYFNMRGVKGCVMWVCVDPANEASGVPVYVRGSHKWGREFKPNLFLAQTPFPGSEGDDLPDIEGHLSDYDIVRFETKPGDIIVHHFRTVHGAGGNGSSRPRRAASLRYSGEDMRYFRRPGAPPQPYHDHTLEDGDVLDSLCFPVVWPRPFPGFRLSPVYDAYEPDTAAKNYDGFRVPASAVLAGLL